MKERNVGREIAIILATTVVLGGAFAYWLIKSIEQPEPIGLPPSLADEPKGVKGADDNADLIRARATAWGRQLHARDYAGARSAMAAPLRENTTPEQFAAMVENNAYLAGAQDVTIMRTTEQRAGTDPASASLRGTGVLTSTAGAVEITLHFMREPDGMHIVSVLLAGVPVLQAVEAPSPRPTPPTAPRPRKPRVRARP